MKLASLSSILLAKISFAKFQSKWYEHNLRIHFGSSSFVVGRLTETHLVKRHCVRAYIQSVLRDKGYYFGIAVTCMPRGKHKNRQHKHINNCKSYAAVHRNTLQRSSEKEQVRSNNHNVIQSLAQNHVDPFVLKKLKAYKFIGSQVTHTMFGFAFTCTSVPRALLEI